jgi:hypothetical protein
MTMNTEYPPTAEEVIVQCVEYRCLARYVGDRQWRTVVGHRPLLDVKGWTSVGSDSWHSLDGMEPEVESGIPLSMFKLKPMQI